MSRLIHEIAKDIQRNWPKVHFAAKPYLDAMKQLHHVSDMYGHDSARSIINYFLSNASTWRGEMAKQIKAELKALLKEA